MSRNAVETVMGAVVLAVAVIFLFFAYGSAQIAPKHGYELQAKFDRIDGIRDGGDVRISGIKVGTITSSALDPKTYQAILKLSIDKDVQVPTDSVATITSSGLLGDKFLQLVPGAEDKMLSPGGEIRFTQPAFSLEAMLGQFVFSMQNSGKSSGGDGASNAPGPAPSGPAPSAGPAPSKPPAASDAPARK